MTCPICDQKPMNCDCTPREREMYRRHATIAAGQFWRGNPGMGIAYAGVLTDAEREAVEAAVAEFAGLAAEHGSSRDASRAAVLRGLLERMK